MTGRSRSSLLVDLQPRPRHLLARHPRRRHLQQQVVGDAVGVSRRKSRHEVDGSEGVRRCRVGIVSSGVECSGGVQKAGALGPPAVATRRPALRAPDGFPPFSWPTGVVYDVDLDIVTVVTLGGEGFFYRYDARKKQWLDYRSLNNIDITSIAYDPQAKRYVAWTSEGALLSLSSKGEPLGRTKDLKSRLTGFGALYDRGNARPPPLMLAPRRFPSRVAAPLRKPTPDTTSAERPLRSAADWRYRPTADMAPDESDSSKAFVQCELQRRHHPEA